MPGHRTSLRRGALAAGLIATATTLAAVPPEVLIDERTEHYDLDAVDAAGLTRQMAERGPAQHGRRAWAFTAWELRSHYTPVPGPGGCRIEGLRLGLSIVTTLPRWTPPADARARLRSDWKRLGRQLLAHEDVHRAHALQAAQAAAAALAALAPQPDCDTASLRAQEALRDHVAEARRLSHRFDVVTDHGARAGVRLAD